MVFSDSQIQELNSKVQAFQEQGVVDEDIGTLTTPIPMTIEAVSEHAEARMKKRGITKEDAQQYIDKAMVMFEQSGAERRLYVSDDGNSAVQVEGSELKTAYSAEDFDDGMKAIIDEVKKYE